MSDLTPETLAQMLTRTRARLTTFGDSTCTESVVRRGRGEPCGTLAALPNDIVRRWLAVRDRVFAAHECQPVWRPTTCDEIQPGWEIRARRRDGSEAGWGAAHHQDDDGDWRTEAETILTLADLGWTCETTAPLPEPEPWDEALVGVVSDALAGAEDPGSHWDDDARRVLDALAARGYLDRAAITGGEQS